MIAGLSAANAGFSTALIGPVIDLDDKRTTALLEPSIDHLKHLGLGKPLDAFATPMKTMRLLDGSRRLIRAPGVSFEAHEIGLQRFGLNCPNAKLNAALDEAIRAKQGITRFADMAEDYSLGDKDPTIRLRSGQRLSSAAIIASDGRNSAARKSARIGTRRWSYPQTAVVGVVEHALPHDFISTELHTETGPFTFVPMPDTHEGTHRSSFVCVLSPKLAQEMEAMDTDAASDFMEGRSLHVLGSLKLMGTIQLWPLEGLVASSFAKSGVFLAGEAAHAFPPIGAQGLNLSIRDVRAAVSLLTDARERGEQLSAERLARRYNSDRRVDVWSRTLAVDALNRSLLTNLPFVHVGRAAALGAASAFPALRSNLMQLGLGPFSLSEAIKNLADAAPTGRLLERLSPSA